MSEPIKAGDLVMLVRHTHACAEEFLGQVFSVDFIHPLNPVCNRCAERPSIEPNQKSAMTTTKHAWPLNWLKRIPPISELEGEKRDEEITA